MQDSYYTIDGIGTSYLNEKRSKFYGFAIHVQSANQALDVVAEYRKKYHDSRHVCWAYRIGMDGEVYRVNDDGEPSGTAGKPILGQILSQQLSDLVVIVVRYFGGIKLGTSGLIEAYRQCACDALIACQRKEVIKEEIITINFDYPLMGEVMRIIKETNANIKQQQFTECCRIIISIRLQDKPIITKRIEDLYGASYE